MKRKEISDKDSELVLSILDFAAGKEGIEEGSEVSVTFVSNERIREINRDYREKDQATDVISFALEELGEDEVEIIGEGMPRILGDIVISIERTREQAEEYGHLSKGTGLPRPSWFSPSAWIRPYGERRRREDVPETRDILDAYGLQRG